MPRYDFRTPRLFVDEPLSEGAEVALVRAQANYLVNVLRLKPGAHVALFNGRDGEWRASLLAGGKKAVRLAIDERIRAQAVPGDLHYLFAPLKHARLDYMAQKAVEMGASRLQPVITRHTQVQRVNLERMRTNAIEAAEQCGILTIPEVKDPLAFSAFVDGWVPDRLLVFCDEEADVRDPVEALKSGRGGALVGPTPVSLLIGPEGGFAPEERTALMSLPNVLRIALGPRILRADTAAVAALALAQAVLGDWR
ncbi:MAG: rRNA (uracil1498-N3)-methyltransferase [Hyphomicrobiales bacterium]|jgi:16S rRNA (uracil1498-N3)-methyltransferase|nr:rRNA (uracil1498-N3)-methyltransferase [Hyphomicrobiales bacterium]